MMPTLSILKRSLVLATFAVTLSASGGHTAHTFAQTTFSDPKWPECGLCVLADGPWSDRQQLNMTVDPSGRATVDVSLHTGPFEEAIIQFSEGQSPHAPIGQVVSDTGWTPADGYPYNTVPPFFSAGENVHIFIRQPGVIELLGKTIGDTITLCGPGAKQQEPPPTSHAQVESCMEVVGGHD